MSTFCPDAALCFAAPGFGAAGINCSVVCISGRVRNVCCSSNRSCVEVLSIFFSPAFLRLFLILIFLAEQRPCHFFFFLLCLYTCAFTLSLPEGIMKTACNSLSERTSPSVAISVNFILSLKFFFPSKNTKIRNV